MDILNIVKTITGTALNAVTGGLPDRIMGIIEGVTGTGETSGMSPEQKAALKIALESEITAREANAHAAAGDAERNLTARIGELEGTAADLRQAGWLGRVVLFARGLQRPTWGFGTLYMDYMVFSDKWTLVPESNVELAFWTVNILVLGFLFGERAVKNILPLVAAYFGRGKGENPI